MTPHAWDERVAIPFCVIAVTLLHEFAHHLDVVTHRHDVDALKGNDEAQHSETWDRIYSGLIEAALEKKFITADQAARAQVDLDERMKRREPELDSEPAWQPAPDSGSEA